MKNMDITIIDLRNGDVFIKFGNDYAHTYFKGNKKQILEDMSAFEEDNDTDLWDNNEIENWDAFYESYTTDELTVEELKEILEMEG